MSWISDRLKNRSGFKKKRAIRQSRGDTLFEKRAAQCWIRLTDGLQWDAKQLQRNNSEASFKQLSDYECRISSPSAKIAVVVNADLAARTISYSYEPQQTNIAVPEPGLVSGSRRGRMPCCGVNKKSSNVHPRTNRNRFMLLPSEFEVGCRVLRLD